MAGACLATPGLMVGRGEADVLTHPRGVIGNGSNHARNIGLVDRGIEGGPRRRRSSGDATGRLAILGIIASTVLLVIATFSIALNIETGDDVLKARVSYTPHDAIMIMGDAGFTSANGVTDGTGSAIDPFIIENWEIDASLDGFGVYVYSTTDHYIIRNVHVFGAGSMGVVMYQAPHGAVEGCLMDNGMAGILLMETNDCDVTGNEVTDQELVGIELYTCQWVNLTGNTLLNNNMSSLAGIDACNITVSSNTCSDSNWSGIMAEESGYWLIDDNNVSGNGFFGIGMNNTWEITIEGNDVTSNAEYGVYLGNSTDISVFHNVFIGNGVQALQDSCVNMAWDDGYPSGGNYWSDYAGSDDYSGVDQDVPGADGIGDTPYLFDTGGNDRYPWMTPDMVIIPEFGALVAPLLSVALAVCVISWARRGRRHS